MATWATAQIDNPTTGQVMADTGPFANTLNWSFLLTVSSTITCVVVWEQRNAANTVTMHLQEIPILANTIVRFGTPNAHRILVNDQERFRLVCKVGVTGRISASLMFE